MKINILIFALVVSGLCFVSCSKSDKINSETAIADTLTISEEKGMNSYISMFEIPATDISRAVNFYQSILEIKIEKMEVEGMQLGILPYEGHLVHGVIIKAEGYKPSADGVTIYLNAGNNLQTVLDKIEKFGGNILVHKTAHADGNGFFAVFLDSEGNKMALNSPN